LQGVPDFLLHPFDVGEHFVVPEPADSVAGALQRFGSYGIPALSILVSMGITIELNYKARLNADEVTYVFTDGVLPSEFEAGHLSATKEIPQELFGIVGISSQVFRPCRGDAIASHETNIASQPG
jgi:hypothetical protein